MSECYPINDLVYWVWFLRPSFTLQLLTVWTLPFSFMSLLLLYSGYCHYFYLIWWIYGSFHSVLLLCPNWYLCWITHLCFVQALLCLDVTNLICLANSSSFLKTWLIHLTLFEAFLTHSPDSGKDWLLSFFVLTVCLWITKSEYLFFIAFFFFTCLYYLLRIHYG